jgi:hypothetical protein
MPVQLSNTVRIQRATELRTLEVYVHTAQLQQGWTLSRADGCRSCMWGHLHLRFNWGPALVVNRFYDGCRSLPIGVAFGPDPKIWNRFVLSSYQTRKTVSKNDVLCTAKIRQSEVSRNVSQTQPFGERIWFNLWITGRVGVTGTDRSIMF